MPDTDPVVPYGANLAGVKALVPEAPVPEALGPGDRGVTAPQVRTWIASLSARVDVRLSGWRRLRTVATAAEIAAGEAPPRDRLEVAAADLVHNGAASYLEAARFPERASKADTSYAEVLWRRFVDGLDELTAWLAAELDNDAGGTQPGDVEPAAGAGGLGYSFPAASFTPETMRW